MLHTCSSRFTILASFNMILVQYNFWAMRGFRLLLKLLVLDSKLGWLVMIVERRYADNICSSSHHTLFYYFILYASNFQRPIHFQRIGHMLDMYLISFIQTCWTATYTHHIFWDVLFLNKRGSKYSSPLFFYFYKVFTACWFLIFTNIFEKIWSCPAFYILENILSSCATSVLHWLLSISSHEKEKVHNINLQFWKFILVTHPRAWNHSSW